MLKAALISTRANTETEDIFVQSSASQHIGARLEHNLCYFQEELNASLRLQTSDDVRTASVTQDELPDCVLHPRNKLRADAANLRSAQDELRAAKDSNNHVGFLSRRDMLRDRLYKVYCGQVMLRASQKELNLALYDLFADGEIKLNSNQSRLFCDLCNESKATYDLLRRT